jgi:hypothetical protein
VPPVGNELCQSISDADVEVGVGFRVEESTLNPEAVSKC